MEHYVWLWIAVIIVAIITEFLTDQLISIWFIPGALAAAVLSICSVEVLWQVLVFAVLSAVAVPLGKIFLGRNKIGENSKTNIDAIIGEKCIVSEKIDNFAGCGIVKIKGQLWSARGVGESDVYEAGEILQVVAIEGVKLICKKI